MDFWFIFLLLKFSFSGTHLHSSGNEDDVDDEWVAEDGEKGDETIERRQK